MIPNRFEIAHITITFTSPMIVASGASTDVTDAVCMRDPNGVPTIPGTSIAGVLRHAFEAANDTDKANAVFGSTEGDGGRSLLTVGWGHAHDSTDKPVSHAVGQSTQDSVVEALRSGVFRDHVRIDEDTGAAADGGKFDETLVPRGARFTFALLLDDAASPYATMDTFVDLLQQPHTFIGGKSRRGFGAFEVSKVARERFDLNDPAQLARFAKYSFDMAQPFAFQTVQTSFDSKASSASYQVHLKAKDFVLPGGGVGIDAVFDASHDSILKDRLEHADMFPVYETSIAWGNGMGKVEEPRFYIPATSIKGTLRHRTLFYTRVLCEEWIESSDASEDSTADQLMNLFFGTETAEQGVPGAVYVSEPVFSKETTFRVMQHVALDRFTQGPLRSALFGEVLLELANQPFDVNIVVDWKLLALRLENNDLRVLRSAFEHALDDLVKGRLSLGAAGSRGHGKVEGQWISHSNEAGA